MDQINANLDRIADLSDDELGSLMDTVVSEFEAVETQERTPDVMESIKSLANAAKTIKSEKARRVAEAEEAAKIAAEAAAIIKGEDVSEDVEESDGVEEVKAEDEIVEPEEADEASAEPATAEPVEAADAEEPVNGTDAPEAPAAPDAETAASDEDVAQGGTDTPEHSELTDEEKKKVSSFASDEAPAEVAEVAEVAELAVTEESAAPAEEVAEAAELSTEEVAEAAELSTTEEESSAVAELAADEEPAAEPSAEVAELSVDEAGAEPSTTTPEAELASDNISEISEEPVTASLPNDLDVQAPAANAPVVASASVKYAPVAIVAGADIPGVTMGSELPDLRSVAQAIITRRHAMGRTSGGDGEHHMIAQFSTVFPEERTLDRTDADGNRAKIDGAVESLVAAGGIAAPEEVRYELYGLGEDVRPVKDSLAVFGADRGGIRYITPPVLADLNGAVSLWTLQDDIDAAAGSSPTKPALRVAAGAEQTVNIEAIPLILTFGNMGARAYPELVERQTKLGMIQHARFAETRLLTRIGSLSTAVTAAKELGAARDIFVQLDTAAAGYRNRHRMDEKAPLRVIFPAWFKNALRADLTKQLPGDGNDDTFGLADAKINAWFSERNINVTWTVDGETGQILGAQAAGALNDFPTTVIWYLFSEGTFLFLDGGTLDLGIVRDSTLNATNDYKLFFETFEGVAKVGVESLRISSQLSIAGASVGTVAPTV